QALAAVERTGESWCLAELHRLNAEIQLVQLRTVEAEETLMLAIEVARAQSAKLFELRSACSLAHLRYHHGRPDEANSALLPVYEWFSEGFDSEDLREAKSVLDLIG
ncbi:MAG: hypothetical protein HKN05_13285, partial [Rhizobiales bacterium]|nr:hypothetical protein [Hyphomicrobiales bacterium]